MEERHVLPVVRAAPTGPVMPLEEILRWSFCSPAVVPYALGMRRALKIKRAFEQYLKLGTFRADAIMFVANDFRVDWDTVCSIVAGR